MNVTIYYMNTDTFHFPSILYKQRFFLWFESRDEDVR